MVQAVSGNVITVTAAFDAAPQPQGQWVVEKATLNAQLFRVVSAVENSDSTTVSFTITALQYNASIYDAVDGGTSIIQPPISALRPQGLMPPANIVLTSVETAGQVTANTVLDVSWDAAAGAVGYQVWWRKDDGNWQAIGVVHETHAQVGYATAGVYRARVASINAAGDQSVAAESNDYTVADQTKQPGFAHDLQDLLTTAQTQLQATVNAAAQAQGDANSALAQIQTLQSQVGDITGAAEWDSSKTYDAGDLVQYGGSLYRSLVASNVGHQPDTATADWDKIGDYASLGDAVAANSATLANHATQIGDNTADITANSTAIQQNASAIAGKADSSALSSLASTVTSQGDTLTSQGNAITGIQEAIPSGAGASDPLAKSSALNSLSGTVSSQGGQISANSTAIGSVQAQASGLQSQVTNEISARQSGDSANASSIQAVQASIAYTELMNNGSGENGFTFAPPITFGVWVGGAQQNMGTAATLHGVAGPWFTCAPPSTASVDQGFNVHLPINSTASLSLIIDAADAASGNALAQAWFYDASDAEIDISNRPAVFATNGVPAATYAMPLTPPAGTAYAQIIVRFTGTVVSGGVVGWRAISVQPTAGMGPALVATRSLATSTASKVDTSYTLALNANGNVAGYVAQNNGTTSGITFDFDTVGFVKSTSAGTTTISGGLIQVSDASGHPLIQIGFLP